jgi:hypothetical protein
VLEREESRGIAESRDWGRAIDVSEEVAGVVGTGTGRRRRSWWDELNF